MINYTFWWLWMPRIIYNLFLLYYKLFLLLLNSLRCIVPLKFFFFNPNLLEFRVSSLMLEDLFAFKLRPLWNHFKDWICLFFQVRFSCLFRLTYNLSKLTKWLFVLKLLVNLYALFIRVPRKLGDLSINKFMACTCLSYLSWVLWSRRTEEI